MTEIHNTIKSMQRILVTGNACAGKTPLARILAGHKDLPYVGLDSIVWQPGWVLRNKAASRS